MANAGAIAARGRNELSEKKAAAAGKITRRTNTSKTITLTNFRAEPVSMTEELR